MTCGLAWFFTEAWIFALKAKAGWLLVLLGFTSTIVVFTQSYLCFVMISNRRVVSELAIWYAPLWHGIALIFLLRRENA